MLSVLIKISGLHRVTCYYHVKRQTVPDKYLEVKVTIAGIYYENKRRRGALHRRGYGLNRTAQRLMKNLVYSVRDRWRNGIPIKVNLARLRPFCWNRTLKRRSQTRSGWQMSRSLAWTDRNSTCRQSLICAVGTSSAIPFQTGLYCPGQPKCSAKPLRKIPTAQIWISISIRAGNTSINNTSACLKFKGIRQQRELQG